MVQISREAIGEMIAHAQDEAPNECCGLLIGTPGKISRVARARNRQASPTRYLIEPEDHFGALRAARAVNLAVVGAYHSHPASAAVPSETDLAEGTYPEFVYVIVSLANGRGPDVRGYRLTAGGFSNVTLVAVDP